MRKNRKKRACHWCGNTAHEIETCQEFVKKPMKERTQFFIRKGLCLCCLTHGHMAIIYHLPMVISHLENPTEKESSDHFGMLAPFCQQVLDLPGF